MDILVQNSILVKFLSIKLEQSTLDLHARDIIWLQKKTEEKKILYSTQQWRAHRQTTLPLQFVWENLKYYKPGKTEIVIL